MHTEARLTRLNSDAPRENISVSILRLPYEQRNAYQHPIAFRKKNSTSMHKPLTIFSKFYQD